MLYYIVFWITISLSLIIYPWFSFDILLKAGTFLFGVIFSLLLLALFFNIRYLLKENIYSIIVTLAYIIFICIFPLVIGLGKFLVYILLNKYLKYSIWLIFNILCILCLLNLKIIKRKAEGED